MAAYLLRYEKVLKIEVLDDSQSFLTRLGGQRTFRMSRKNHLNSDGTMLG